MKGQPGAFVEQDDAILPDANDTAMAGREHTGPAAGKKKTAVPKEVKDNA